VPSIDNASRPLGRSRCDNKLDSLGHGGVLVWSWGTPLQSIDLPWAAAFRTAAARQKQLSDGARSDDERGDGDQGESWRPSARLSG
jgi:hypothetical protein